MVLQELGQWIPATLLVIYNVSTLLENLKIGLSIRTWCNNQRMARITTMNSWFFGFLAILLKRLRISNIGFEITRKDETFSNEGANENDGRFIFNKSPVFIPGTTILLIQLTALVTMWLGWQPPVRNNGHGSGVGEVFCSTYLVVCYWPFLKGLFEKGKYGIPLSTICKAMVLAFLFVQLCNASVANWSDSFGPLSCVLIPGFFELCSHFKTVCYWILTEHWMATSYTIGKISYKSHLLILFLQFMSMQ